MHKYISYKIYQIIFIYSNFPQYRISIVYCGDFCMFLDIYEYKKKSEMFALIFFADIWWSHLNETWNVFVNVATCRSYTKKCLHSVKEEDGFTYTAYVRKALEVTG